MNIKTMLAHCGVVAEVAEFATHDGRSVQVTPTDETASDFVVSLMQAQGFYPVPAEHATTGVLEFTNSRTYVFELAEDESADPALGESTARNGTKADGSPQINDLDAGRGQSGNRGFKVLKDGETHKFAQKIFTTILNNNDMAQYGAFLYDVDHLFGQYYREPEPDYDEEDMPQRGMQGGGQQNGGGVDLGLESASAQLDHMAELASNRSQFLKAIMKLLSGDNGEALANAFVTGDRDGFAKHMQTLTTKAVAAVPAKDDDDGGSDEAGLDGDGGGDSGDDAGATTEEPDDGNDSEDAAEVPSARPSPADDEPGEVDGDNAGGMADKPVSSAEVETENRARPKAPKPGGQTRAPTPRVPNAMVGERQ